jgi:trans-aconitate methyltransferase
MAATLESTIALTSESSVSLLIVKYAAPMSVAAGLVRAHWPDTVITGVGGVVAMVVSEAESLPPQETSVESPIARNAPSTRRGVLFFMLSTFFL